MDEETVDRIRAATNGNYGLGGSRFEAEIAATLKRRVAGGNTGRPSKAGAELGQLRRMDGLKSWSVPYSSQRLLIAGIGCEPKPERLLRSAELCCLSGSPFEAVIGV